jgi:MIP family channel proteins
MKSASFKPCTAEAIGTFALTFLAAGAICADRYSGGELGLLGIAVAYAGGTTAMMLATQRVSGGHLNPAITIALAANGRIKPLAAGSYIGAQLAGAAVAGFALARLYTPEVWQPVNLGTPTLSAEVAFSTGAFLEALLTFLVVFTVLQVAADDHPPAIVYGFPIGVVLIGCTLAGGPLTGAAMNPARVFGPALASGIWRDHLAYWVGPISGGLAAAIAQRLLQPPETG